MSLQKQTERYQAGLEEGQDAKELAKGINLKVAMDMLTAARDSISSTLIQNCFHHAGFVLGPVLQPTPDPGIIIIFAVFV